MSYLKAFLVPPKSRNTQDITEILEITQNIEFFQKITNEKGNNQVHAACCQLFTLEEFKKGDKVIHVGEIGDKFYIILQGRLTVSVPTKVWKTIKEIEEDELRAAMVRKNTSIEAENSDKREKLLKSKTNDNSTLDELVELTELRDVATFGPGKSFGELSLISEKPRAATITCESPTILAVLSKHDFKKVLGSVAEKSLNDRVNFLQNLPLFSA